MKNSFVEMWTVFLCKKYIFSKWHIFIQKCIYK